MSLRLWRRLHTERGPRADSWVQVGFGYGRKGGCARTNGLYEDVEVWAWYIRKTDESRNVNWVLMRAEVGKIILDPSHEEFGCWFYRKRWSTKHSLSFFNLLIWEREGSGGRDREREREREIDLFFRLFIHSLVSWFLCAPWLGIKLATLAYRDDTLNQLSYPQPGPKRSWLWG